MFRTVFLLVVFAFAGASLPAHAASFDCAKASTPFEHAICDHPDLSAADDRLAKTYETAIGGLSEAALASVRADQRAWLDYAQRACTQDAKPLTGSARYDERGLGCLTSTFDTRSSVLEESRMIDGNRFYPVGEYSAMPDPNETDTPDSNWPVATHELSYVQLDSEESHAAAFNAFVQQEAEKLSGGGGDIAEDDASSDIANTISVKEVAGTDRITLDVTTYWYGHGAAHGNGSVSYLHYLIDAGRPMVARDLFGKKGWQSALLKLALEALKAEHGDNLMLDDESSIADAVADPERWDISNPYGLIIQFQPYEIAAYAYGAPTATISWEKLQPYLAETADQVRY
ncbi:DUF3298 domain-containing protein [Devosia soli]|uniref:DUF3298 domain-containing protein n=1 Tax=Devosia soli TaxID=361041 RepID=UPI00069B3D6A|nr:DUF3298 domain-containing protein [Devosia soli]